MKPAISILAVLLIFTACKDSEAEISQIKLKGSESMHGIFMDLKKNFENKYSNIEILVEGGGSRTGLMAIKEKQADIGLSSFAFDLAGELGNNHSVIEKVIAYDGIVIITNENNPIDSLTNGQIEQIYEGTVDDWQEIGGRPGTILPIIRDENSGTQRFFKEHFSIEETSKTAVSLDENLDIVNKIHGNVNAIGFIGFAYFTHGVHEMRLATDHSKGFRAPTKSNLLNDSYPLKRGLRIYYEDNSDEAIKLFLNYLSSNEAKLIIESYGLIATN